MTIVKWWYRNRRWLSGRLGVRNVLFNELTKEEQAKVQHYWNTPPAELTKEEGGLK